MSSQAHPEGIREVSVEPGDLRRGRLRRWGRSARELGAVPVAVMLAFAILAAISILADQTHSVGLLNSARANAGKVVGKQAASTALQSIATGVLTVASITFSVLLLAVQQTASSLSPVVLDQFIRRRSNQAFLGFFIGLALFSYVVMTAVQDQTPPILGAALAAVLTVVALPILLLLVYSTVAQMRPANVVRVIHDRTMTARAAQARTLALTRRHSTSVHPVAAQYRSRATGYLTHLDLDLMRRALAETDRAETGDAEICLHISLGGHVSYGDIVATVRDGDLDRAEGIARRVATALTISTQRDLAHDPTTGIDELGNIAWTSGSSAKHNPEVAREALHAIEDLAARWLDQTGASAPSAQLEHPLAIVYTENTLDRLFDIFSSLLIAAHESQQHTFAAAILHAYANILDSAPEPTRQRLSRDLGHATSIIDAIPSSPQLRAARRTVEKSLQQRTGPATTDQHLADSAVPKHP
jgi:uncharacterized membrane protein